MSDNKKININDHDTEDEGGSGTQGSHIGFTDFISSGESRDDLLSEAEIRNRLAAHPAAHESRVKAQKNAKEISNDLKNGVSPQTYGQGLRGQGMNSSFKEHHLARTKQFGSGADKKVNAVPNINDSRTNETQRSEPENQFRLRHAPNATPSFNPKPIITR